MTDEPAVPDPDDWRTWRREGDRVYPPVPIPVERSFQIVWQLTCEKYGIDPDNPPPMRKDIVRIVRRGRAPEDAGPGGEDRDDEPAVGLVEIQVAPGATRGASTDTR